MEQQDAVGDTLGSNGRPGSPPPSSAAGAALGEALQLRAESIALAPSTADADGGWSMTETAAGEDSEDGPAPGLLSFDDDILMQALTFVEPRGLARLASTCARFGGRPGPGGGSGADDDKRSLVETIAEDMIEHILTEQEGGAVYRLEKRYTKSWTERYSKMEEYRQRIREKKVEILGGHTVEELVAQALLEIEGMQICVNGQVMPAIAGLLSLEDG